MSSDKETANAEIEEAVAQEMRLVEEERTSNEGEDFYLQMVESMTRYKEKLTEFYNQLMIMRLEAVRIKLDSFKCRHHLEDLNNVLDRFCDEAEDISEYLVDNRSQN